MTGVNVLTMEFKCPVRTEG